MRGAQTYEPAFAIGDTVTVLDQPAGEPLETAEVVAVDPTELLYDLRTEDGRDLGAIPEARLVGAEGGAIA